MDELQEILGRISREHGLTPMISEDGRAVLFRDKKGEWHRCPIFVPEMEKQVCEETLAEERSVAAQLSLSYGVA